MLNVDSLSLSLSLSLCVCVCARVRARARTRVCKIKKILLNLKNICLATVASSLRLAAYISSGGLHGEIRFETATKSSTRIRYSLKPTLQYPDQQWLWSVTQFPVDYTIISDRCDERHIGQR